MKVCTLGVPEPVDHLRGEIFANFFALKYLETGKWWMKIYFFVFFFFNISNWIMTMKYQENTMI